LGWFQEKVELLSRSAHTRVISSVRERRSEMATKMTLVVKGQMQPAYDLAKDERGPGMRQRILGHLVPRAKSSAQPIYSTIQVDLLEGLNDLELIIVRVFRELAEAAQEKARIITHNANIDVNEANVDPMLTELREMYSQWA
jgi:hypothetical protein